MSLYAVAAIAAVVAMTAAAILWFLRRRCRKSPAERERERRLTVNAAGRITDGFLIEAPIPRGGSAPSTILFYRYRAAGVEYSAAQDISGLRHLVAPEPPRPGEAATVKYDPRNPPNSIILCELWSGLSVAKGGSPGNTRRLSVSEPAKKQLSD